MSIRRLIFTGSMLLALSAQGMAGTKVPSTVALEVTTPLNAFYGEAIDGTAQVTASDGTAVTGTVTFYDGTKSFCTLPLTNGASCPEGSGKGFSVGTHLFTAVYSGDATHEGATSNAVTVMVNEDTTTIAVASSMNPVAVGGGTIYTAAVAGAHAPASGTVTFLDGTVVMGFGYIEHRAEHERHGGAECADAGAGRSRDYGSVCGEWELCGVDECSVARGGAGYAGSDDDYPDVECESGGCGHRYSVHREGGGSGNCCCGDGDVC